MESLLPHFEAPMWLDDLLRHLGGSAEIGYAWTLPTFYTKQGGGMIVTVTRTQKSADGIFGNMAIDIDPFKCVTLENLQLSIPAGTYPVWYRWSNDFQQIMPHIIVPGRTAVMLHWANWPKQLLGCIALGDEEDFKDDAIDESKDAWIKFAQAITDQPTLTLKIIEDYA